MQELAQVLHALVATGSKNAQRWSRGSASRSNKLIILTILRIFVLQSPLSCFRALTPNHVAQQASEPDIDGLRSRGLGVAAKRRRSRAGSLAPKRSRLSWRQLHGKGSNHRAYYHHSSQFITIHHFHGFLALPVTSRKSIIQAQTTKNA